MMFDPNQPIYLQIMAHFKHLLVNGTLKPGERVASVRELALEYGVNPNTMQKALSELEREGYLFSERTSGRLVTKDEALIARLREATLETAVQRFVDEMTSLGVTPRDLPGRVTEFLHKT